MDYNGPIQENESSLLASKALNIALQHLTICSVDLGWRTAILEEKLQTLRADIIQLQVENIQQEYDDYNDDADITLACNKWRYILDEDKGLLEETEIYQIYQDLEEFNVHKLLPLQAITSNGLCTFRDTLHIPVVMYDKFCLPISRILQYQILSFCTDWISSCSDVFREFSKWMRHQHGRYSNSSLIAYQLYMFSTWTKYLELIKISLFSTALSAFMVEKDSDIRRPSMPEELDESVDPHRLDQKYPIDVCIEGMEQFKPQLANIIQQRTEDLSVYMWRNSLLSIFSDISFQFQRLQRCCSNDQQIFPNQHSKEAYNISSSLNNDEDKESEISEEVSTNSEFLSRRSAYANLNTVQYWLRTILTVELPEALCDLHNEHARILKWSILKGDENELLEIEGDVHDVDRIESSIRLIIFSQLSFYVRSPVGRLHNMMEEAFQGLDVFTNDLGVPVGMLKRLWSWKANLFRNDDATVDDELLLANSITLAEKCLMLDKSIYSTNWPDFHDEETDSLLNDKEPSLTWMIYICRQQLHVSSYAALRGAIDVLRSKLSHKENNVHGKIDIYNFIYSTNQSMQFISDCYQLVLESKKDAPGQFNQEMAILFVCAHDPFLMQYYYCRSDICLRSNIDSKFMLAHISNSFIHNCVGMFEARRYSQMLRSILPGSLDTENKEDQAAYLHAEKLMKDAKRLLELWSETSTRADHDSITASVGMLEDVMMHHIIVDILTRNATICLNSFGMSQANDKKVLACYQQWQLLLVESNCSDKTQNDRAKRLLKIQLLTMDVDSKLASKTNLWVNMTGIDETILVSAEVSLQNIRSVYTTWSSIVMLEALQRNTTMLDLASSWLEVLMHVVLMKIEVIRFVGIFKTQLNELSLADCMLLALETFKILEEKAFHMTSELLEKDHCQQDNDHDGRFSYWSAEINMMIDQLQTASVRWYKDYLCASRSMFLKNHSTIINGDSKNERYTDFFPR